MMGRSPSTAAIAAFVLLAVAARPAGQSGVQRAIQENREYLLTFDVTQGTGCGPNPGSGDQITILFTNVSTEGARTPPVVFGEDIISEFSFSARDMTRGAISFRRRVRDRTFLDARFIRVVNAGTGSWCSGSLSLTIDSTRLLDKVPLTPRKGNARKGIQGWNRNNWSDRTYWEENLQRFVRSGK